MKNQKPEKEISEKLQHFSCDCIYELGTAFNSVLCAGKEYEVGFNEVMSILGVPENEREDILSQTFYFSEASGIPYHKLSPLNQFIVTIPPYVFYCLRNKLPEDEALREEAQTIFNDEASTFPRYLQEELGVKISHEIKGALWCPRPIWLSGTGVKILIALFTIFFWGLLYFLLGSTILRISSYIVGILILFVWLYYLFAGKTYTRITGSVMPSTVWQFNILPLLTAICLLLTGNIIFIPMAIIFLALSLFPVILLSCFPNWSFRKASRFISWLMEASHSTLPFISTIVYGWFIGVSIGELLEVSFPYWRMVFGITGIVVIQIPCSLIVNFVTGLYDRKSA